jgi:glyoxylase-like metal-dependent hydrolase (beta-lactamase superfamily II)
MDVKEFPTGELMQLSPLVARVLAPNPSPFTYTGTQTYVVGKSDVAVIDPGPADPAHLASLLRIIDDRPVRAILCTHTHRDHSPGSGPLAKATGARPHPDRRRSDLGAGLDSGGGGDAGTHIEPPLFCPA